jgi:DNA-binding NarL/FixJ family response regulator
MERPLGIDRSQSVARGQRGSVDRDGERAVRVFVVGEVRVYCDGLAHLLSAQPSVEVVGVAGPTRESMQQIASAGPDVVLLDSMTARRGNTVRLISTTSSKSHVIAFAVREEEAEVLACAQAGVAGYIACDASSDELAAILCRAGSGELACSPRLAAILFRQVGTLARDTPQLPPLTPREREILELIDSGLMNKEIASALSIELTTVKNHVHHILEKLGVIQGSTPPGMNLLPPARSIYSRICVLLTNAVCRNRAVY